MTMTTVTTRLISIAAGIVLSACSNLATSSETNESTQTTAASPAAVDIPRENLTGESLFQILLAEVATNRRELGAAAALYSEIGLNHNDVDAINRAVILNQSIGDYQAMYSLTAKWLELRPADNAALQAHSLASVATGRVDEGTAAIDVLLQNDPDADTTVMITAVERLNVQQRAELTSKLAALETRHPDSASLLYTQARLKLLESKPEEALSLAEAASNVDESLETSLFRFQLMLNLERVDDAEALIVSLDKKYPNEADVALQYSSFLFQYQIDNVDKLSELYTRFPGEPIIARTYARAAFENGDLDSSEAVYLRLLNSRFQDEARYFLGRIHIENSQIEAAVDRFKAISSSPFLISGLAEWVNFGRLEDEPAIFSAIELARLEQPDEDNLLRRLKSSYYQLTDRPQLAMETLDDAIAIYPTDTALMYDKAMLAASLTQFDTMEDQLQQILQLEPNNINALNALGYTWADQNKNLELAGTYIERALAVEPDSPAFQDSKGWLLYRQGDSAQALVWLEKAYENLRNDEIAAHVAEVLWSLGRKEEAQSYFDEVKRLNPDSNYIDHLNQLFNQ